MYICLILFPISLIQCDRVKFLNEELHERVESAELQIRNISTDYRAQIQSKEVRGCFLVPSH